MARQFKRKNGFKSRSFKVVSDRIADSRANAYQAFRSKGVKARKAVSKPSFVRQLKALVASKKKEGADVTRNTATQVTTTIACLTSSTGFGTAASGTGLLDADADEVLINHVTVSSHIYNAATVDLDPSANVDAIMRKIYVWFNKPLLVASAAGTLPPITEVLTSDAVDALYVTQAANGGRFQVLSDKTWNLGTNSFASTAGLASRVSGKNNLFLRYKVKVNKMCKYNTPSVSGTPGGHYDSDIAPGRIDKGLLICYTLVAGGTGADIGDSTVTRINYTA